MLLFHVTERSRIPSILKKGLLEGGGDFGSGVYAWRSRADAEVQISRKEGWSFDLKNPALVVFKVPAVLVWAPRLRDILRTLGVDAVEDLDPDDEDYYRAIRVVRVSVPSKWITQIIQL